MSFALKLKTVLLLATKLRLKSQKIAKCGLCRWTDVKHSKEQCLCSADVRKPLCCRKKGVYSEPHHSIDRLDFTLLCRWFLQTSSF